MKQTHKARVFGHSSKSAWLVLGGWIGLSNFLYAVSAHGAPADFYQGKQVELIVSAAVEYQIAAWLLVTTGFNSSRSRSSITSMLRILAQLKK